MYIYIYIYYIYMHVCASVHVSQYEYYMFIDSSQITPVGNNTLDIVLQNTEQDTTTHCFYSYN